MRWIGMVFVISAAVYGGMNMARELRIRCYVLRQISSALELMRSELSFCGTPLPKVFALMAAGTDGNVATLFSSMAQCMDKYKWISPDMCMKKVLAEQMAVSRISGISDILIQLCSTLGSYNLDHQLRGIDLAATRVKRIILESEQELKGKSRMYRTIGVCVGLALAILFV